MLIQGSSITEAIRANAQRSQHVQAQEIAIGSRNRTYRPTLPYIRFLDVQKNNALWFLQDIFEIISEMALELSARSR